jgi:PTS system cellobiose-specific IIC component
LAIFAPVAGFMESWYGFVLIMLIYTFLYSMGISSWVLTPVTKPVLLAAITANVAMAASGTATPESLNVVTSETIYSTYLWLGGIGCTLPLVLMMVRSKSKFIKALGTASLVPAIFNINEPVVFGAIAWNPVMMIPMWLQSIVLPSIIWIFTKVIHFAPIPTVVFDAWYMPFPISTWLTTRSVNAIILMLVVAVVASLIWYPFFKIYEKQQLEAEQEEAAK